jgi:hypothetical protein
MFFLPLEIPFLHYLSTLVNETKFGPRVPANLMKIAPHMDIRCAEASV